jgi:hypothetical protein
MGWVAGSASLLLLISAGLSLFAQQTPGWISVAVMLLVLYLAFWSYVWGVVGLLFLSMRWLVGWRRVEVKRAAMSRYPSAELRSRRLEKPELKGSQSLQQSLAPSAPNRSSKESNDGNEGNSLARVA